jgi:hypothetical protein
MIASYRFLSNLKSEDALKPFRGGFAVGYMHVDVIDSFNIDGRHCISSRIRHLAGGDTLKACQCAGAIRAALDRSPTSGRMATNGRNLPNQETSSIYITRQVRQSCPARLDCNHMAEIKRGELSECAEDCPSLYGACEVRYNRSL